MKRLTDYSSLLINETPLIDVRAPVEFIEGSLPGSVNLPLMTDQERHEVGKMYKAKGQEAAIELGHTFVSGEVKKNRIQAWAGYIKANPNCAIYCFRGGLRSRITQQWLQEAGMDIPVVEGGYKAVRTFLLKSLEAILPQIQFQIVGGPTGSGKTSYIKCQKYSIDLEGLAHHRGSAFGGYSDKPQPAQIDFENRLIMQLLKLKDIKDPVFVESESRMIGRCALPLLFFDKMQTSPRKEIALPLAARVENIFQEYIVESPLGLHHDARHFDHLAKSLAGISAKLGGLRYREITENMEASRADFAKNGTLESNKIWIEKLLLWYYDPLYNHARERSKARLTKSHR